MSAEIIARIQADKVFLEQLVGFFNDMPALKLTVQGLVTGGGGGGSGNSDVFSVKSFGAVGDGSHDDTAAFFAARNFIAGCVNPPQLDFPAGIYNITESPNWGINKAHFEARGDVRIRNLGSGPAVILDGGLTGEVHHCTFGKSGRFVLEGLQGQGLYYRAFHHGHISTLVKGCGAGQSAYKGEFAVCTDFDVEVSNNFGGWYASGRPAFGLDLGARGDHEPTAYCTFHNPKIEGCVSGIKLRSTLGNSFRGGTSEGHTEHGVVADVTARQDLFDKMDFEANGESDIYCAGENITFQNCDSTKMATFVASLVGGQPVGAQFCKIVGGLYQAIYIGAYTKNIELIRLVYNRDKLNSTPVSKHNLASNPAIDARDFRTGMNW